MPCCGPVAPVRGPESLAEFNADAFETMNNAGEYAVGWFTLSLINAGLAQAKGRSGLAWWFGSLLLGPICTFLIVVLEPEKPQK